MRPGNIHVAPREPVASGVWRWRLEQRLDGQWRLLASRLALRAGSTPEQALAYLRRERPAGDFVNARLLGYSADGIRQYWSDQEAA